MIFMIFHDLYDTEKCFDKMRLKFLWFSLDANWLTYSSGIDATVLVHFRTGFAVYPAMKTALFIKPTSTPGVLFGRTQCHIVNRRNDTTRGYHKKTRTKELRLEAGERRFSDTPAASTGKWPKARLYTMSRFRYRYDQSDEPNSRKNRRAAIVRLPRWQWRDGIERRRTIEGSAQPTK